jgi:hypothetical protein
VVQTQDSDEFGVKGLGFRVLGLRFVVQTQDSDEFRV